MFFNNAGASFTVIPPPPTVTITAPDPSASEVPATDTGKFRIKRTGCTDSDLSVFDTIGGTATNGVDYRRLRGNATIRSGTPSVAITLRPIDDTISEPDETAILTLSPDRELHYRFAQHRHRYDPQQRVALGKVLISQMRRSN